MDQVKLTAQELAAKLAQAQAELNALKQQQKAFGKPIRFKVSSKGGISVYGLNSRFPVTLYSNQWERLIKEVDSLKKFMEDNKSSLSVKAE